MVEETVEMIHEAVEEDGAMTCRQKTIILKIAKKKPPLQSDLT